MWFLKSGAFMLFSEKQSIKSKAWLTSVCLYKKATDGRKASEEAIVFIFSNAVDPLSSIVLCFSSSDFTEDKKTLWKKKEIDNRLDGTRE